MQRNSNFKWFDSTPCGSGKSFKALQTVARCSPGMSMVTISSSTNPEDEPDCMTREEFEDLYGEEEKETE